MRRAGKQVFDATAILALIQDEPGAERLVEVLPEALAGSINVAEVLAKLIGKGMPREQALAAFDALHLQTVGFDPVDAAASAAYVGKGISLGGRCFLATARTHGAGWTSDRALAAIRSEMLPKIELFR